MDGAECSAAWLPEIALPSPASAGPLPFPAVVGLAALPSGEGEVPDPSLEGPKLLSPGKDIVDRKLSFLSPFSYSYFVLWVFQNC